jgi:hypothetical protein
MGSDENSIRSASPYHLERSSSIISSINASNSQQNLQNNGTAIFHQVEVRHRDSFKSFVRADEPLQTLHFSFYTRKKSIGFGLFYLYLPNLSSESINDGDRELDCLPLEKVKELIAASRENIRLLKIGQEGSLGRSLSTPVNTNSMHLNFIIRFYCIFL